MVRILILTLALLLTACGSPPSAGNAAGTPETSTNYVQIASVDVRVAESQPPQVFVQVTGSLQDGCTTFAGTTQERSGNTIELSVLATHSGGQVCTMIAQMFDETVQLSGDFPPGEYTVVVNGTAHAFRV